MKTPYTRGLVGDGDVFHQASSLLFPSWLSADDEIEAKDDLFFVRKGPKVAAVGVFDSVKAGVAVDGSVGGGVENVHKVINQKMGGGGYFIR